MSIGSNIKQLRESHGLTQIQLGQIAGVTDKAVSTWESDTKIPRMGAIQKIADYFKLPKSAILDDGTEHTIAATIPPGFAPFPNMTRIPIVGQIACGEPITAEENIEGYASAPELWKADFALICRGRSMEPKIMDGDLVAIRSDIRVETGQIAAVRIGDEATLKKVYFYPERVVLRPINDEFEDIVFEGEEMNKVSIEGKAVGLCRDI